jgi:hypothetical protein
MPTPNPIIDTCPALEATCPVHGLHAAAKVLAQDDELYFPLHKSVIVQYATNSAGAVELHLYYGAKEITFDEVELFGFGQGLSEQSHFYAVAATHWGGGYEWVQVQTLLSQLIDEGILQYADDASHAASGVTAGVGAVTSLLPPAQTTQARNWLECTQITQEITGRSLELAYLEMVIPVFRVAHLVMDAEGRQVGESNVFPSPLRLDIPTKWRTCIYPGSRYQDSRPMNVSALKSMRAHWGPMMATLLRIREAYLQRYPAARNAWTVGNLERLSTLVLAVPTYALMRSHKRVENGNLHPVLSSVFRVTDGLRMTTHQMLFVPVSEATWSPNSVVSSAQIYEYAERNYAFASPHGVCAGPKSMIDEFFAVLVDGHSTIDTQAMVLDEGVETALQTMERALDYGLLGLQVHAVTFSLWPAMTRAYAQLSDIVGQWSSKRTSTLDRLAVHLQEKMEILKNGTMHATEAWRVNRENIYADIFEQCNIGLGLQDRPTFAQELATATHREYAHEQAQLRAVLYEKFAPTQQGGNDDVERVLGCLMRYLVQTQATLKVACEIQARINALLGRPAPSQDFNADDMDIHVLLQGRDARRLPYLMGELEAMLDFKADVTQDAIVITGLTPGAASKNEGLTEFANIGLASTGAISTSFLRSSP